MSDDDEDIEKVVCTRHCGRRRYGFDCPQDCGCDCHEAYEWCTFCQNTGQVDADPLNDHVVQKMDCPKCAGTGWRLNDGYQVIGV